MFQTKPLARNYNDTRVVTLNDVSSIFFMQHSGRPRSIGDPQAGYLHSLE